MLKEKILAGKSATREMLREMENESQLPNIDYEDSPKVCPTCKSPNGHIWIQEWRCNNCKQDIVIKEGKPIP